MEKKKKSFTVSTRKFSLASFTLKYRARTFQDHLSLERQWVAKIEMLSISENVVKNGAKNIFGNVNI